ncbi:hypothetical protein SAMN04488104_10156 [Algoriphagus faecimaris]|uniref:Uncharacterized protein n=1 Tax=Algoriphagus faecimaris TaxID=686796 RepID=A0A1G6S0Z0_9BACT|nr:hypothetical protein [Algoriphagus faecimaris]SDD10600.1 hypothetical protein SAMN04488104_10156 [Algoriphagus faecimaris]
MGFIPLFLTVGGACLLFFLTVKNSLQKRLNLQRELIANLSLALPQLGLIAGELADPEVIQEKIKETELKKSQKEESNKVIRELKINKLQYNKLIKKAPYNWVAKLAGFQAI